MSHAQPIHPVSSTADPRSPGRLASPGAMVRARTPRIVKEVPDASHVPSPPPADVEGVPVLPEAGAVEIIGEPIPAAVREAITLFQGPLEGVTFPDVDGPRLQTLATGVHQRALAVARARAALDEARRQLDLSQQQLLERVTKGIAYARVFAAGQPELSESLEALALVRAEKAVRPPARRKRKPRAEPQPKPAAGEAASDRLPLLVGQG